MTSKTKRIIVPVGNGEFQLEWPTDLTEEDMEFLIAAVIIHVKAGVSVSAELDRLREQMFDTRHANGGIGEPQS